jgi:hypothetical protein
LKAISAECGLVLVLERYVPPVQSQVVHEAELDHAWNQMGKVDVVYLYKNDTAAAAEVDPLIVNVGTESDSELRETQLGGGTNSRPLFSLWKGAISQLKRGLPDRGFVHSPSTGLFSAKPMRFVSPDAARAQRRSKLRLSLIGTNEVRLDKKA